MDFLEVQEFPGYFRPQAVVYNTGTLPHFTLHCSVLYCMVHCTVLYATLYCNVCYIDTLHISADLETVANITGKIVLKIYIVIFGTL